MTKKPDLDDKTVQIARRMLSMPPKPHGEMKLGKGKPRRRKSRGARKQKIVGNA